jgi:hypothetical protein
MMECTPKGCRVDLRPILGDPIKRKQLMMRLIKAIQSREGIDTTDEQAERAYDAIQRELNNESR